MNKHEKIYGFTLIELLVVISIIAVLMAVMMPALGTARQKARTVVCKTRHKSLSTAFFMYANDNNDEFLVQDWSEHCPGNPPQIQLEWWHRILPYLSNDSSGGTSGVFRCPSGLAIKEFGDKTIDSASRITADIGLHWFGATYTTGQRRAKVGKISEIKKTNEFASFFDYYPGSQTHGDISADTGKFVAGSVYASKYATISSEYAEFLYRHKKGSKVGINAVYLDGHTGFVVHGEATQSVPEWDLWEDEWKALTSSSLKAPDWNLTPSGYPRD